MIIYVKGNPKPRKEPAQDAYAVPPMRPQLVPPRPQGLRALRLSEQAHPCIHLAEQEDAHRKAAYLVCKVRVHVISPHFFGAGFFFRYQFLSRFS
jgi:hypothetical protein